MSDAGKSDAEQRVYGRPFEKGKSGNPSGRPKKLREFQEALYNKFYERSFIVMKELLECPDDKVRAMALKELWDRMFGKAKQEISTPEGEGLKVDLIGLAATLRKFAGEGEEQEEGTE